VIRGRLSTTYAEPSIDDYAERTAHTVAVWNGRVAWNGYGVYNFTKFGVDGFTESLAGQTTASPSTEKT
jgi:NAD(P)-dependent dehydrogenase (short-subunit alcohol dehydrogenase family)